jgi:N-acetylmuramoyl-L-alanine amidase
MASRIVRYKTAMKNGIALAAALLATACASGPPVDTRYTATGQDSRVQFLVLHFTSSDFPAALRTLTEGDVSAHYLVRDDPPTVYRLVDENRRAWHAGASAWLGHANLNEGSIGIEIVNRGIELGDWQPYPEAQVEVVVALVKDIVRRHGIRPERIVGHSDIAPLRKVDPGPRFPWKRLADEGLIRWPPAAEVARRREAFAQQLPDVQWFQRALARHGFSVPLHGQLDDQTMKVIAAFQMKYRPSRFDGVPDAETAALVDVLVNP